MWSPNGRRWRGELQRLGEVKGKSVRASSSVIVVGKDAESSAELWWTTIMGFASGQEVASRLAEGGALDLSAARRGQGAAASPHAD